MRGTVLVVLASGALVLGACGPTTQIYEVTGARELLHSTQEWTLEVDVEECRASGPSASAAEAEGTEQGFVELGRGCQLPMRWGGKREPGIGLRRFALVGGPYRCTLNGAPLSIRNVEGTLVGDGLTVTVDFSDPAHPEGELGIPGVAEHVMLRGAEDGSQSSNMICGLPATTATK